VRASRANRARRSGSDVRCFVDRDQIVGRVAGDWQVLIERDAVERSSALLVLFRSREVYEYPAHQARRDGKEVGTVLPLHAADVDQAQIYLVDERGGLKQVVLPLAGHVPLRDPPQLAVDEGDQPLDGTGITRSPVDQERRHIVGRSSGNASSIVRDSGQF
jgi:hypothetical protein